jgi:hypothetical protein
MGSLFPCNFARPAAILALDLQFESVRDRRCANDGQARTAFRYIVQGAHDWWLASNEDNGRRVVSRNPDVFAIFDQACPYTKCCGLDRFNDRGRALLRTTPTHRCPPGGDARFLIGQRFRFCCLHPTIHRERVAFSRRDLSRPAPFRATEPYWSGLLSLAQHAGSRPLVAGTLQRSAIVLQPSLWFLAQNAGDQNSFPMSCDIMNGLSQGVTRHLFMSELMDYASLTILRALRTRYPDCAARHPGYG